jgi:hypothetical protein
MSATLHGKVDLIIWKTPASEFFYGVFMPL